jgi:hypothetical protein
MVGHAEHRGGRTDPQSQREDGREREARPPPQLTKSLDQILDRLSNELSPAHVTLPSSIGLEAYLASFV